MKVEDVERIAKMVGQASGSPTNEQNVKLFVANVLAAYEVAKSFHGVQPDTKTVLDIYDRLDRFMQPATDGK